MKQARKEKGLAHLGLIVVAVIVIAAVAFGGLYVWQKNEDDKKTKNSNNSQTTGGQNTQKETDPSEGGKYLVITEWNVRFKLSDELRGDVEYGLFTFKNGDQAIYFASKKIAAKSTHGDCILKAVNDSSGQGILGGTVAVSRFKTKPDDSSAFYEASSGYWYSMEATHDSCYEEDTGQETVSFNNLVSEAVKKLEASP